MCVLCYSAQYMVMCKVDVCIVLQYTVYGDVTVHVCTVLQCTVYGDAYS